MARFELRLTNYDLENVIFNLLKKREPCFHNWTLTNWFNESNDSKSRVLRYFLRKLDYCEVNFI